MPLSDFMGLVPCNSTFTEPRASVREREFDLSIQAPGAEQGGVQGVRSIRSHDHLHSGVLVETILGTTAQRAREAMRTIERHLDDI